jgi:hypothetical protein
MIEEQTDGYEQKNKKKEFSPEVEQYADELLDLSANSVLNLSNTETYQHINPQFEGMKAFLKRFQLTGREIGYMQNILKAARQWSAELRSTEEPKPDEPANLREYMQRKVQ